MLSRKEAAGAAVVDGDAKRFVRVLHTSGLETMPKGKGTAAADGYIGKRGNNPLPYLLPNHHEFGLRIGSPVFNASRPFTHLISVQMIHQSKTNAPITMCIVSSPATR